MLSIRTKWPKNIRTKDCDIFCYVKVYRTVMVVSPFFIFSTEKKIKLHFLLDYSVTKATRIINAELVNTLGNLLSRVCGKIINKRQVVPICIRKELNKFESSHKLVKKLKQLPSVYEEHFESYNFYLAIDEIISTLHLTNGLVQDTEIWKMAKDPTKEKKLDAILGLIFESLRISGILLQPITPNKAKQLLDKINVSADKRSWNDTKYLLDDEHEERPLSSNSSKLMDRIK